MSKLELQEPQLLNVHRQQQTQDNVQTDIGIILTYLLHYNRDVFTTKQIILRPRNHDSARHNKKVTQSLTIYV